MLRDTRPDTELTVKIGDVTSTLNETEIDRIIFDLPEPGKSSTPPGKRYDREEYCSVTCLRFFK
jgi:hypothetical protein